MRPILIIALLIVNCYTAWAQADDPARTEQQLFKVNLLVPGVEYELALGSSTTININPYVTAGYSSRDGLIVLPAVQGQFRKYYNLVRRQAKGKRTAGNSGNFVGLAAFGVGSSISSAEGDYFGRYYGVGAVWGLQRTYASKLNIGLSGGVGYGFSTYSSSSGLTPLLSFRLGWVLAKKSFR